MPLVAPGVTKDEVISVSADGSAEVSRSSASGDRVRHTASGVRLRDMPEWLEEFTEGLVDRDSKSSGSDREHLSETPLPQLSPQKTRKTHSIHAFSVFVDTVMVLCCCRDPSDCLSPVCGCRDPGDCLSLVLVWSLPLLLSEDFRSGMVSDGFQTAETGFVDPG